MPSVEVEGLGKTYNGTPVLNGISFTVPDGTFTTLLGPSGCGKTTTLRLLAGFERPDAGRISIGESVVAMSASRKSFVAPERRNVGVVFQSYALWPHMTAFEQVAYPLRVRHKKAPDIRSRVQAALDLVGLGDVPAKYPNQMSGGQQQRVALARALVFEPSVLLLDEPLSNLDAELRKQMRVELARIHEALRITFVYVTHDQSEALALSDQILLMKNGNIVERGAPHDIYLAPRHTYSAQFVGAANCLPGSLVEVTDDYTVAEIEGGHRIRGGSSGLSSADIGRKVVVTIKPEDIKVGSYAGDPDNGSQLVGKVSSWTYLGAYVEVLVDIGGSTLCVHVPGSQHVPEDNEIVMSFPNEQVRIVTE